MKESNTYFLSWFTYEKTNTKCPASVSKTKMSKGSNTQTRRICEFSSCRLGLPLLG